MSDDKPRACTPPATVRTLAQWQEWRRQEDERMYAELQAAIEAWIELVELRAAGRQPH